VPFYKFFNIGESYAADVDFKSSRILEKVDGSLIKLWHDAGSWHVSTNGTIDAKDANVNSSGLNYRDIFDRIVSIDDITGHLDAGSTYMFELVSPDTRIIVKYPEAKLYFLGARNNDTLQEYQISDDLALRFRQNGILFPREYSAGSIDDVVALAQQLDPNEEGFVVVDSDYHRVKVKSPLYIKLSHFIQDPSTKHVIALQRAGEIDEVKAYLPELQELECQIESAIVALHENVTFVFRSLPKGGTRKEIALSISDYAYKAIIFWMLDHGGKSVRDYLDVMTVQRVADIVSGVGNSGQ
jgi:hypothetical protein